VVPRIKTLIKMIERAVLMVCNPIRTRVAVCNLEVGESTLKVNISKIIILLRKLIEATPSGSMSIRITLITHQLEVQVLRFLKLLQETHLTKC
jgi:hypothetical protein